MKKTSFIAIVLALIPSSIFAGTIANFKTPAEVREITTTALGEWTLKASDPTGCGGGDCCPDTTANDVCQGLDDPLDCCTGTDLGTCNDEACESFALQVQLDPAGWAAIVEEQYQFDADWLCNTWLEEVNSNRRQTACTTTSGTPIIDVSRIASEIAGRRNAPQ